MKNLTRLCLSLALLMLAGLLSRPSFAQVSFRWFDINPSRSNRDDDDPNGASGGRVNHVGAASDLSRVFAATEWGGLYTSFDQGNTWVRVNTYSPTTAWDVKVDPRDSRRVYATSFFDGRAVNPRSGISISNDGGNTWNAVNIPALNTLTCRFTNQRRTQPSAWQIAINPTNPAIVFIGTSCGLARSFNNGVTWDFIDPSPGDARAEQIFSVVAHGGEFVDVIGEFGYFRSTNNGGNWSAALPLGTGPASGSAGLGSSIAISPQESGVVLAASGTDIWESIDGGNTWPTSITLPLRNGRSNVQGRIPFIKTNQLSSSSQFDVWYGDVNLFKTTATTPSTVTTAQRTPQNSWTNMQEEGHWDNGDILFDPRFTAGACPRIFSSDGGVYLNKRVTNPRCQSPEWEQPTITPHATWVWGFDGRRIRQGVHALTYGLQDNGGYAATVVAEGHNPPGPNWNNYFCCDVSDNAEDAGSIISLEGASSSGRTFRLRRGGQDGGGQSEISNYPTAGGLNAFDSGEGLVRFGDNAYVLNTPSGVFFTNNITSGSISWTPLSAPTAPSSGSGNLKLANLGGRPNVFYHTSDGNPSNLGVIFRSSLVASSGAPGSNWTPLTLPPGIGSVNTYDVDPNDGNRIIISGINSTTNNFEMWITRNFGGSWTPLPQLNNLMVGATPGAGPIFVNRPDQGMNTGGGTFSFGAYWQPSLLKFNPLDPTTIIAGGVDSGVFLSLDDGNNWQLISNPVNPTSNSPHIPRPLDAYFSPGRFSASTNAFDVWVATRGAGIHKVVVERRP